MRDGRGFRGDREPRQPTRVAQAPRHVDDYRRYRGNYRGNRAVPAEELVDPEGPDEPVDPAGCGCFRPGEAGAGVPGLRIRSSCRRKLSCTSAAVGASVPRPHAISPKPAAPAHSARARCRRPAAQCPAPAAAWVTTGVTKGTHPDVRAGLPPSRNLKAAHRK